MLKRFCDICEKEVEVGYLDAGEYGMLLGKESYDLCRDCYNDIRSHISKRHLEATSLTAYGKDKRS